MILASIYRKDSRKVKALPSVSSEANLIALAKDDRGWVESG